MKKIIFCNIPMKKDLEKCIYISDDLSLPISGKAVSYPINAFLEKTLSAEDELKILLLVKKDGYGREQNNLEAFKAEFLEANKEIGAKYEFKVIDTDFSEEKAVHELLMSKIVDEIEDGSHIYADITYGPKDLPIVLFSALNFAEKFLECDIDNIIYGQSKFDDDGKATNTKICDRVPLFYLNTLTNVISGDDPTKARKMLKTLLSI